MFSSPLIGDLHRLFTANLGLSLGCNQLIRVRSDRSIIEEIMTKIITVIAMLATTSALAENLNPKPPTNDGQTASSAPAPAPPATSARAASARRSTRTPRTRCRRSRMLPAHPVLLERRQLQGVPLMAKIRKSFTHGRAKDAVLNMKKRGSKPATSPAQTKTTTPEQAQAAFDASINSPEFSGKMRAAHLSAGPLLPHINLRLPVLC